MAPNGRLKEGLDWGEDGRDWPNREASRFIEADDITWHVQIMGAGPVLLLLHGTGASTPFLARPHASASPGFPSCRAGSAGSRIHRHAKA